MPATDSLRSLLLDTSSRLFADAADPEHQVSIERDEYPEDLWAQIEDNGLPDSLLPADAGGAELGWSDAAAILRLAGAFALPLPLAQTLIARKLLHDAGAEIPQGQIALLLGDPKRPIAARSDETVVGHGSFAWPGHSHLLILGHGDSADRARLLEASAAQELVQTESRNAAGEPIGFAQIEGIHGDIELPAGSWTSTLETAAMCTATQIAGAMDRVLDLTLEHVRGREQFGRPIAKFQAVQQQVAQMTGWTALVGVAAEAAASVSEAACEGQGSAAFECASAKACASELAGPVARYAHQLHAAIGFTREHALQLFTRRLWSWRSDFGDEGYWQQVLGAAALEAQAQHPRQDPAGEGYWQFLCRC